MLLACYKSFEISQRPGVRLVRQCETNRGGRCAGTRNTNQGFRPLDRVQLAVNEKAQTELADESRRWSKAGV